MNRIRWSISRHDVKMANAKRYMHELDFTGHGKQAESEDGFVIPPPSTKDTKTTNKQDSMPSDDNEMIMERCYWYVVSVQH